MVLKAVQLQDYQIEFSTQPVPVTVISRNNLFFSVPNFISIQDKNVNVSEGKDNIKYALLSTVDNDMQTETIRLK